MGSWWRSEEMTYVSLIFSEEAAPACIRELGILGCIQFTDLNPELTPFQRRYVAFIKRCDEIERKIRYVNGEVKRMGVPVQPAGSVDNFVENYNGQEAASGAYLLESLESKLDVYEQQLLELNKYSSKLTEEYSHKVIFYTFCLFLILIVGINRLSTITCWLSPASSWARPTASRSSRLRLE